MSLGRNLYGAWRKSHGPYVRSAFRTPGILALTGLLLLFGVVGSAPADLTNLTFAADATLRGAGHPGADLSWPQCPRSADGYGLPFPPRGTSFVILGVTAGRPWTHNPCLADQVSWAWVHAIPAQAYTIAGWPSAAQLRDTGGRGPWLPTSAANRLRNAGYGQARSALSALSGAGFHPPVVWIDVEPHPSRPWPTGTRARQAANRWVLEGVMRGFADAATSYGIYSYPRAWREITGGWRLPQVPVWATAGRSTRAAAIRTCGRRSFSSGRVLIAQWYDDARDSDISCPPFRLAPPVPPPRT